MDLISELEALGVDTQDALKRFSGNSDLYKRMIGKFPASAEGLEVMSFMKDGDYATAVSNAHTLKGVTGNLSITPLYTAYTEIVNCLRANEPEKAIQTLENILPVQQQIINCIKENS